MVFPIPSKPSSYRVVSPAIFDALEDIVRAETMVRSPKSPSVPEKEAIRIHSSEQVGDYEIVPIEMLSETSGEELNAWLRNQDFIESPYRIQAPYLKKGGLLPRYSGQT